jgi:predicted phage tail protein
VTFDQIETVGANVTTYRDSGLTESTNYYRVRAYNSGGNSDYSNIAKAPAAPTNLTATAASSTSVDLSWADNSDDETQFTIERSTNGGLTFSEIDAVGPNVTQYTDTGLTPNTYSYRVRASNLVGDSAYSDVQTVVLLVPAAPSNLTAIPISSTEIDLSWTDNASDETEFRIERSIDGGVTFSEIIPPVGANVTTFADIGLNPATTCWYQVRASNSNGNSLYSNTATAATLP